MKLFSDILTYGAGNVLPKLLGLLLLPLFTRFLSPEDYGIIALLGLIGIVLTPLMSAGLGAGLAPQFFRPEFALRRDHVIWTALLLVVIASLAVTAIVWFIEDELYRWLGVPAAVRQGFRLGIAAFAVSSLLVPLQARLQFCQRAREFTCVTLISTTATLALTLLTVIWLRRGVVGWFEGALGGQVIAVVAAVWLNHDLGKPVWNGTIARGLAMSGALLMPTTFFIFVLQNGNKWLLQEYRGLAELGIYNVAFNLGLAMTLVTMSIQSAWFPAVMAQREQHLEKALQSNVNVFVRLAIGLAVVNIIFAAAAKPLVVLMTAPAFHSAFTLVALNAHAHVWGGLFYVAVIPLYFDGRENQQTAIFAAATAVYAISSWWFVPRWGAYGCSVSTILGFAFAASAVLVLTNTRLPQMRRMFLREGGRLLSVAGMLLTSAALFYTEARHPEWWPYLSIVGCAVGFGITWFLLRPAERAAFRTGVRGMWSRLRVPVSTP